MPAFETRQTDSGAARNRQSEAEESACPCLSSKTAITCQSTEAEHTGAKHTYRAYRLSIQSIQAIAGNCSSARQPAQRLAARLAGQATRLANQPGIGSRRQ